MQVRKLLYSLLWSFFILFWTLVALLIAWGSWRHFSPWEAPSVFLQSRLDAYWCFLPALYVHIFSSPLILILGSWSLWPTLRDYSTKTHRLLGKLYVALVLLLAAPSGFVMAFWALGGWAGISCFLLLSVLWAGCTWWAWQLALKRQWDKHQLFMRRSFALCTSAFWLRFFSFLGAYYWHWRGPDIYVYLAWASWLFPLFLVELWAILKKKK